MIRSGTSKKLKFRTFALAALGLVGCSSAPAGDEALGRVQDDLYVKTGSLWRNDVVHVCFQSPDSAEVKEKRLVREALARTWEDGTGVHFVGFGQCGTDSPGIHVRIANNPSAKPNDDDWPHTRNIGAELDGQEPGMVLNPAVYNGDEQFQYQVAHEFGHALGFRHEQARPDTDKNPTDEGKPGDNPNPACTAGIAEGQSDSDPASTPFGAWDTGSIMNYCSVNWGQAKLSAEDRKMSASLYGEPDRLAPQRLATQAGGIQQDAWTVSADFDRNGRDDLGYVFNDGGYISIDVYLSTIAGYRWQRWETKSGGWANASAVVAGDFDADGFGDIGYVWNDGSAISIDVHKSNGSSFTRSRWATRQGGWPSTIKVLAGDFNRDMQSDIAVAFNDGGHTSIDVHQSTGSAFQNARWSQPDLPWSADGRWAVGDFDGNGFADIARAGTVAGSFRIDYRSAFGTNSFVASGGPTTPPTLSFGNQVPILQAIAADFDQDGADDLALAYADYRYSDGYVISIDVLPAHGTQRTWSTRATGWPSGILGELRGQFQAGYFSGDARPDVQFLFDDDGRISIDRFVNQPIVEHTGASSCQMASICARGGGGIRCGVSDGGKLHTSSVWQAGFADTWGWNAADYYSTVQFADIDGDGNDDVCGRAVGGLWCASSQGYSFGTATLWSPDYADAYHWDLADHYATIKLADVNGDGKADVCGRAAEGIWCATSTGTKFNTATLWSAAFSDAAGGSAPQQYETISYPDLNNDHKADMCGRTASNGIVCALSTGSAFGAAQTWAPGFTDAETWYHPQYYSTLRFPDLNGDHRPDFCIRGKAGVWCGLNAGTKFNGQTLWAAQLNDAQGWSDVSNYSTIEYPDLDGDGKADICARADAGIVCGQSSGSSFASMTLRNSAFSDANGWKDNAAYYSTIQFGDIDGDGKADVCGKGTGFFYCVSGVYGTGRELFLEDFADSRGWTGPEYYSTLKLAKVRTSLCPDAARP